MTSPVTAIHSRDNAFVKELRKLSHDSTAYRKQGQVWLEGDHLCRAALARGLRPKVAVFAESFWPQVPAEWAQAADKVVVLADALFADVSGLESPARMGYLLEWLPGQAPQAGLADALSTGLSLAPAPAIRAALGGLAGVEVRALDAQGVETAFG